MIPSISNHRHPFYYVQCRYFSYICSCKIGIFILYAHPSFCLRAHSALKIHAGYCGKI